MKPGDSAHSFFLVGKGKTQMFMKYLQFYMKQLNEFHQIDSFLNLK